MSTSSTKKSADQLSPVAKSPVLSAVLPSQQPDVTRVLHPSHTEPISSDILRRMDAYWPRPIISRSARFTYTTTRF